MPASVQELFNHGHEIVVEKTCGAGVGFSDWDYEQAGAPGAVDLHAIHRPCALYVTVGRWMEIGTRCLSALPCRIERAREQSYLRGRRNGTRAGIHPGQCLTNLASPLGHKLGRVGPALITDLLYWRAKIDKRNDLIRRVQTERRLNVQILCVLTS